MITAVTTTIGRSSSSSHSFLISRALTILHLPTAAAQPKIPSSYPQNRYYYTTLMMTRPSIILAVTTTCTQLFLLIGGIQSFATPFHYHRGSNTNDLTIPKTNDRRNDLKLWEKSSSSSGGSEAVLDLSEGRSTGSVLTDLVTNGAPKEEEVEDCIDDTTTATTTATTNGNTAAVENVAQVITKQSIQTTTAPTSPTSSSGTKIIATDDQFIKSDPDKRHYRAITLPNQLTVLLTSDPMTDVESASVHVRAGHFDDPPNRAGLAHFHEHVR
jgi:hypothetical protein